jgi:hypothetical protein
MTINPFEYAARYKLRFATMRGDITVEQLWDVPLRSRDDFNLNMVAKTISRALKDATEESFVEVRRTMFLTALETNLEIVKHIIEVKLKEEELVKKRADNRIEREKLLAILAEKQTGKLSALTEEEIKKRIESLEV